MINSYESKIAKELKGAVQVYDVNDAKIDCIVYVKDYMAFKKLLQKQNYIFTEFPFISAMGIKLKNSEIFDFAQNKLTCFITKQTKVFAQIDLSKNLLQAQEFYDRGIYGQDVSIAIIDTGISSHLDFCMGENRIIKFIDLINHRETPYDDNGHGTFVASIAAGSGMALGGKYKGIAPKCKIVAIKAIEKSGETGAYTILEAMQWIAENHSKYNIKVVCMSFGSTPLGQNDPLIMGASVLWGLGIVVVAAAGNSGPETATIKSPGYNPRIITVGGMDDGRDSENPAFSIAKFSSRGPAGSFFKPDIVAPAINITGADIFSNSGNFYTKMSGTSVATPMIAGVCALMISQHPYLSPDMIKVRLLSICQNITKNKNEEGYGFPQLSRYFR